MPLIAVLAGDGIGPEVTAEARTFRFVWSYSGVSLKLAGFGQVTGKGANGKDADRQNTTGREDA